MKELRRNKKKVLNPNVKVTYNRSTKKAVKNFEKAEKVEKKGEEVKKPKKTESK